MSCDSVTIVKGYGANTQTYTHAHTHKLAEEECVNSKDGTNDSSHMAVITAAADKIVIIDARLFLPIERHISQIEERERERERERGREKKEKKTLSTMIQ